MPPCLLQQPLFLIFWYHLPGHMWNNQAFSKEMNASTQKGGNKLVQVLLFPLHMTLVDIIIIPDSFLLSWQHDLRILLNTAFQVVTITCSWYVDESSLLFLISVQICFSFSQQTAQMTKILSHKVQKMAREQRGTILLFPNGLSMTSALNVHLCST